jgi:sarcosine oxidase subunit alpha
MSMREGNVAGFPAHVFRVSYTGELSYEINVACRYGLALWEALIGAGERLGITPIGSETNHVLRVEKGFLSLGHEVDGTADPYDLGMSWVIAKHKNDFIGKRALEIRRANPRPRRELVGLLTEKREETVPEGSPITPGGRKEKTEGFVSACVWSVVQERTVALAMLENGRARMGESIAVRLKDKVVWAQVTAPVFYDPKGEKLRS